MVSGKCLFDCAFFRDFECEAGFSSGGVAGRLFSARSFWVSNLPSPLFVQNTVTYGYALIRLKLFLLQPFLIIIVPPLSIQILLKKLSKNCYVSVVLMSMITPTHVVNPLTVVEGKKLKFVLDLPKSLSEIFGSGFYFFTFDLESGYHHVGIVQHHQQFLGFSRLFSHAIFYL